MGKLERFGNFSSSEIWKLTTKGKDKDSFGKPALTYISEKQMEMRLCRPLSIEHGAKETSWGILVENRVHELLPMNYKLSTTQRLQHPTISNWVGIPDVIIQDGDVKIVGDIKCPYSLKSFCTSVDLLGDVEVFKAELPEYYWQLVSNCILVGAKIAEIIFYVPYQKELSDIRELAENWDGDQNKFAFLNWANDSDLPYLIEGKYYKNLNIFRFEVPQSDIDYLTNRVELAVNILNNN